MLTPDSSATFTTTVVIAGISIVLGMLLLLIIVFYCFGKIVSEMEGKSSKGKKKNKNSTITEVTQAMPVPVQQSAVNAPAVGQGISPEVVAVISAAIAEYEGSSAVITGIRALRVKETASRNPWAAAAVSDNARSF